MALQSMPVGGGFWGWRGAVVDEQSHVWVLPLVAFASSFRTRAIHWPRLILVQPTGSGTSRDRTIGKDAGHDTSHVRPKQACIGR